MSKICMPFSLTQYVSPSLHFSPFLSPSLSLHLNKCPFLQGKYISSAEDIHFYYGKYIPVRSVADVPSC